MANNNDPAVNGVTVQLRDFMRFAYGAWLQLCDANFHIQNITFSLTKFWYVVSKLDADTLLKLQAFFQAAKPKDQYAVIWRLLCHSFEPIKEQKIDTFLTSDSLGDERPSTCGLELDRLLTKVTIEDIKRRVLVYSLPACIATAISGSLTDLLDDLTKAADKAWAQMPSDDAMPQTVAAVSQPSPRGQVGRTRGGHNAWQRALESQQVAGGIQLLCRFYQRWSDPAGEFVNNPVPGQRASRAIRVFHVEKRICSKYQPQKTSRSVAERGWKTTEFSAAWPHLRYDFLWAFLTLGPRYRSGCNSLINLPSDLQRYAS